MPSLRARDGIGNLIFFDVVGSGTESDPHLMKHSAAGIGSPEDGAASSDTGTFGMIALLKRLLTKLPTLVSGRIPIDAVTSTNPNSTTSIGVAASGTLKNTAGSLFSYACTNLNASTRYLQFFNSATAPTAGATPRHVYPVYGNAGMLICDSSHYGNIAANQGLFFSTGISWGVSTTPLTFTAATPAEVLFEARWL